jgi:protein-disulfide isomerase
VKLILKDLPLSFHTEARPAHEAARCAGAAGKYWAYHDRLFAAQPAFDRGRLIDYAADVGLEREGFARCLDAGTFAAAVENDVAEARALGITGTPTFFINGRPLVGAQPVQAFREAIDEALERRR